MQQLSGWFIKSILFTAVALLFTFVPFAPVAVAGATALIIILPGVQLVRWLGFYRHRWNFETVVLTVTLGLVTSPLVIYWSSLLFGFNRWILLALFSVYTIALAAYVSRKNAGPDIAADTPADSSQTTWIFTGLLVGLTALGVFLAYFELETARGFFPVQMEDWQKHYGVAFALRHTGVPPASMFFYGTFPQDTLVYYYMLHLNGATLDLLQSGEPFLHNSLVMVIVLASVSFSSTFFLLARTLFGSQKAAVWSLAFATVIGGLDVIPIVHRTLRKYREHFPEGPLPADVFLPREHIDNWVSALSLRINTFFAHHIWVPQHLTGLTIVCLSSYLYLKVQNRRKLLIIMPVLLFALLGHSTWIAALVSGCLFVFALIQIFAAYRQSGLAAARTVFLGYAIVATAFFIIAAPFILALIGPNAPKSGIVFEIPKLDSWAILRPFQASFGPAIWARIADLPLHLFIEMGALLVVGLAGLILFWRDNRGSINNRPLALVILFFLFLISGTLTVILFASGRGWEAELGLILNNDLGLRALMPGQLVLALFTGYFMIRLGDFPMPRRAKTAVTGALVLLMGLGAAYSAWEFTAMGLTKYWSDPQLEPDVYQTLRAMPDVTAPQDKQFPVVQHRLHRNASRFQLSLGSRPVAFSTGEAVVFHQNVHRLALALELSRQAFDNGLPLRSYQLFNNLGANYIFVGPAEREATRHPEKYEHPQYFRQVYQQGNFEIHQVQPPEFNNSGQPLARFDNNTIEFKGYFIDLTPIYPGDSTPLEQIELRKGLVTAWQLTDSIDKNYTVFVHFVDAQGNIVAQADHQLWAWDVNSEGPTSTWTPNLTHLDVVPVPEAALTANTPLSIRLGLWLPDTGQQFPVETQLLQIDAGGRLVAGNLEH